jgi:hypothetical protein
MTQDDHARQRVTPPACHSLAIKSRRSHCNRTIMRDGKSATARPPIATRSKLSQRRPPPPPPLPPPPDDRGPLNGRGPLNVLGGVELGRWTTPGPLDTALFGRAWGTVLFGRPWGTVLFGRPWGKLDFGGAWGRPVDFGRVVVFGGLAGRVEVFGMAFGMFVVFGCSFGRVDAFGSSLGRVDVLGTDFGRVVVCGRTLGGALIGGRATGGGRLMTTRGAMRGTRMGSIGRRRGRTIRRPAGTA